jgi:hypothetical protein
MSDSWENSRRRMIYLIWSAAVLHWGNSKFHLSVCSFVYAFNKNLHKNFITPNSRVTSLSIARFPVCKIWHKSRNYRFRSKIPDQRVYHHEAGRLMFPRSLQWTFIPFAFDLWHTLDVALNRLTILSVISIPVRSRCVGNWRERRERKRERGGSRERRTRLRYGIFPLAFRQ